MPCLDEEFISNTVERWTDYPRFRRNEINTVASITTVSYVILRYRDAHEPFSNMKFAQLMLHRNMEEFDAVISEKGRKLRYGCRSRYPCFLPLSNGPSDILRIS